MIFTYIYHYLPHISIFATLRHLFGATPDPPNGGWAGNPLLEDILVFTVASAVSSILPPGPMGAGPAATGS